MYLRLSFPKISKIIQREKKINVNKCGVHLGLGGK